MARIGSADLLSESPTRISVDGKPFIVTRAPDGEPIALEATCPHQGGVVDVENDDCLRCPQHGWEFDAETGSCTTAKGEELDGYAIEQVGETLFADIPTKSGQIEFGGETDSKRLTVELVAHATLRFDYGNFTFVTDPWLEGPAFLGSWIQYPQPETDADELAADADAVWITHEHSDHLHIPTLERFDPETPVYVPELNYRRLTERLSEAGLTNVHRLPTENAYEITEGVEAVCFESDSTWNDSILALNFGGFRILNTNDAGINWRIADAIPSFDMITTGFSFGASGYPLTFDHMTRSDQQAVMAERNEGALQQCEQMVEMFDPDYLVPFAKYFELVRPEHEEYSRRSERNRPVDVVDRLADTSVEVVDLLPGESWRDTTGQEGYRSDRDRVFDPEYKYDRLSELRESVGSAVETTFDLSHDELKEYFEALDGSRLVEQVGNHAFTLLLDDHGHALAATVRFDGGEIEYVPLDRMAAPNDVDVEPHVIMECPGRIVQEAVRRDLSWDEVHIGYWATLRREPDDYNRPFWRLLHAPWEARANRHRIASKYKSLETDLDDIVMADLVERNEVQHVLAEIGM